MKEELSVFEKLNSWISGSISLKLFIIFVLIILIMIPMSMVQNIIHERQETNRETSEEITNLWSKDQVVSGPILTIPYSSQHPTAELGHLPIELWHTLPELLDINGTIETKKLKRGIYDVVVYESKLKFKGAFKLGEVPTIRSLHHIDYKGAFLTIGISDLRGVKNKLNIEFKGEKFDVSQGSKIQNMVPNGIHVPLSKLDFKDGQTLEFEFELDLQGSKSISFVPLGSQTRVTLASPWRTPSFDGNFLPDQRTINDEGFVAKWQILELNRDYPNTWINDAYSSKLNASTLGVKLNVPIDNYQKSTRTAKYAILVLSLTFLVFFLFEIMNKRRVHPFQYTLVGLALCLFYVLLVAITEHLGFNLAYLISSYAIISMISVYVYYIFKNLRLGLLMMSVLFSLYGFLFITLQMAEYALLLGSIGLFLLLGAAMYFTRNIDWYAIQNSAKSDSGRIQES